MKFETIIVAFEQPKIDGAEWGTPFRIALSSLWGFPLTMEAESEKEFIKRINYGPQQQSICKGFSCLV